jgi:archaellum component FlaC
MEEITNIKKYFNDGDNKINALEKVYEIVQKYVKILVGELSNVSKANFSKVHI